MIDETTTETPEAVAPEAQVADGPVADGPVADAPAAADGDGELTAIAQSIRCRQHAAPPRSAQTARRARPLSRRADRTARPARVRMRSRKPWVFARRRLFGW